MQYVPTDPVDEFVGSVRHEDTITPGGTASVQEHPRLIAVLTVRVAAGENTIIPCGLLGRPGRGFYRLLLSFTTKVNLFLRGWKCDILFPDVIFKGYGLFVELQKLRRKRKNQ